jgi:Fuc2NAc and GlcNAc transferase
MALADLAWLVAALAVSAALTGWIRNRALARGRLDVPNARSSHTVPTPRGGGLAIVVAVVASVALAAVLGRIGLPFAAVLVACGLLVAAVGHYDDLRGLPALPRLLAHLVASIAVVALPGMAGPGLPVFPTLPPVVAATLLVLGVTWSLNLFNFMDGIDGIAGSQAAFVSAASAGLLATLQDPAPPLIALPLATAGACLGFLAWNWPPARIFMGDVGSGFLGFWLAAVALALHQAGVLSIWASAILGSAFIADATVTLLRRAIRRERWHEAHRSHAYQHLARRLGSHRAVTMLLWAVDLGIALPLATAAVLVPRIAPLLAAAALAGFGLLALVAGAGRREEEGAR